MDEFIKGSDAAKHFGVSQSILRQWDKDGIIKCIRTKADTGQRRYNINSFKDPSTTRTIDGSEDNKEGIKGNSISIQNKGSRISNNIIDPRKSYCYCRVSSRKQIDDLQRQEQYIQSLYPEFEIIKDIGSGLNFKRKGLITLLENSAKGFVKEVVVAHKERLCRFGFELLEWFFSFYKVKLVILEQDRMSADEELSKDILAIIHVFSCRANGRRKYKKKEKTELSEEKDEESVGSK